MIRVSIPHNNIPERQYALHVLLSTCLGLDYDIRVMESSFNYHIQAGRGELVIEDAFFGQFPGSLAYLKVDAIPLDPIITYSKPFDSGVILFGREQVEEKTDLIHCHADLVAGTFFMLSRWEEHVIRERDDHERFPASRALAVRKQFLDIPVVNVYAAWLKAWLLRLGVPEEAFLQRTFTKLITHDIDNPFYWDTLSSPFRKAAGALRRGGSLKDAAREVTSWLSFMTGRKNDPYDVFDVLMDQAEAANLKAHFFFMSGGQTAYDPKPAIWISRLKARMRAIISRGHEIGFHPSYATFEEPEQFKKEKQALEQIADRKVLTGRQHYLRFRIPETWQIWEDAGMAWDSTLGYPAAPGFRCGICYPFPAFDILSRKMLNLYERPLHIMDVTLQHYMKLSPQDAMDTCQRLADRVRKHDGELVLLWHNEYFITPGWELYNNVFHTLITS